MANIGIEGDTPAPRPDIDPEHASLIASIAQEAERVLGGRSVDRADFVEENPDNPDRKTVYAFRTSTNNDSVGLIIRAKSPVEPADRMEIAYSPLWGVVKLTYEEPIFGSYLDTFVNKMQDGGWVISRHYTNDTAALPGILADSKHRLEYADQELTSIEPPQA